MTLEHVTLDAISVEGSQLYEHPSTLPNDLPASSGRDVVTAFRNGKTWTLELMRDTQSLTWAALSAGSNLKLERYARSGYDLRRLLLVVNGMVVEVCRDLPGLNHSDPGYENETASLTRQLTDREGKQIVVLPRIFSLPEPIRLAYYTRINGLTLPRRVPWGMETRLLPRPTFNWKSVDDYLKELRLKKHLPLLEEMIPSIRPKRKSDPYTNFMLFLDARPDMWGGGDVFFVKNHIQDGTIYYIRDGDVPHMMVLEDATTAIDRYCAHVLTGTDSRFDFMPFASPLA